MIAITHHQPLQARADEKLRSYRCDAPYALCAPHPREGRAPMLRQPRTALRTTLLLAVALLLAACEIGDPPPIVEPPTDGDRHEITLNGETVVYEAIDGLAVFEGDIVLGTVEELEQRALTPQAINRDASCNWFWCNTTDYRWPDGEVSYFIADGVTATGGAQIEQAIAHWEARTPIRFIELDRDPMQMTNPPDSVLFVRGSRAGICFSEIGRQGGVQQIRLTSAGECSRGTLIHEIGHALGLWHEQSRSDRNDFVTINWENILADREDNFSKHTRDGNDLGDYDVYSIMHYGCLTFSRDEQAGLQTITPVDPAVRCRRDDTNPLDLWMGQRRRLSRGDVDAINALYGAQGSQRNPVVASDGSGNFVVVWEDDSDENGQFQVYAQGFDAGGRPRFDPVTVNTVSWRQQVNPAVAMNDDGSFVVVWQDNRHRSTGYDIYTRGFHPDGRERFAERIVNADRNGRQSRPDVALDARGRFVVTWMDDRDRNGYYNILARGFHPGGQLRLDTIRVNSDPAGNQRRPAVAMADSGRFVIVWEDDRDDNDRYDILARGFYASGGERFDDFTVNPETRWKQSRPDIAMNADGFFVVVWEDDSNRNGKYEILARGFHPDGRQRLSVFTVNSDSDGNQIRPTIAMNAHGNFVVAWQDDRDGNGKYEILARGIYASGNERFADTTVNSIAHGQQKVPAIASGPNGSFVVAWRDNKPVNDTPDVMARRFGKNGNPRFLDIHVR